MSKKTQLSASNYYNEHVITEEWDCKEGHSSLLKVAESAELFAKQLREGADK